MSNPNSFRSFIRRPLNAGLFLALAVGVWAFILWQKLHSTPVQRHVEAGVQLLAKGRGVQAEREWREAVRLDPRDTAAWELLGDYYIAIKKWPAALDAFRQVWKLRPNTPGLHPQMALAALRSGDFKTAQTHSALALKQNPKDITALKVSAAVAEKNNKLDQQLQYLRQLVALQPQDPNVLMALATVLASQYQYDETLSLLDRVLQLDPQFTNAYALRGDMYYQYNPTPERLIKAEADFKKVLQADPNSTTAHRNLGRVYLRLNRPAAAIRHFEELGRDRPHAFAHLFDLSNAYRKAGNIRKADELLQRFTSLEQLSHQIRALRKRSEQNPDDFDIYLQMARLLLKSVESSDAAYHFFLYNSQQGSLGSGTDYLAIAAKLRPRDAKLQLVTQQINRAYERHIQQGLLFIKRRDYARADWHLGRAVLLRPDDKRTREALMRFLSIDEAKRASKPRSTPHDSTTGNNKDSATSLNPVPTR